MTQTLTIELTGQNSLEALQELEDKQLIRIVKNMNQTSLAMEGEPVSDADFKEWVEYVALSPEVSLSEAKKRWANQRKKLKKAIR